MKFIVLLITNLPQILRLIEQLQLEHKRNKHNRKVKDDLELINKAFETRDADLLNAIFNGLPNDKRADENRE